MPALFQALSYPILSSHITHMGDVCDLMHDGYALCAKADGHPPVCWSRGTYKKCWNCSRNECTFGGWLDSKYQIEGLQKINKVVTPRIHRTQLWIPVGVEQSGRNLNDVCFHCVCGKFKWNFSPKQIFVIAIFKIIWRIHLCTFLLSLCEFSCFGDSFLTKEKYWK